MLNPASYSLFRPLSMRQMHTMCLSAFNWMNTHRKVMLVVHGILSAGVALTGVAYPDIDYDVKITLSVLGGLSVVTDFHLFIYLT